VLAAERFPCGSHGVQVVGLRAVAAGRARRPVDLHDPLAVLQQGRGQSGPIAAGALDGPHPAGGGVLVGERLQPPVAERVGRDAGLLDDCTAGRIDDGGCVSVAVSVHADDEVDDACEHCGHGCFPFPEDEVPDGRHRPG
jgi:hypothetical protein